MNKDDLGRVPSAPGSREPSPDGLGPSGFDPSRGHVLARESWDDFVARVEVFADRYCRVKPSLGMIGEMLWVVGVDFDFHLVPRDSDGSPEGRDAQRLDAKHDSAGLEEASPNSSNQEPQP